MSGEFDDMATPSTPARVELPVACSLEAGAGAQRLARWKALHDKTRPTVLRENDRLVVLYPPTADARQELTELVAAERECCAFADWQIVGTERGMELQIRADHEGLDAIAALMGGQ